ncbi:MAG TPA: hypothetical protein VJP89_07200 [Pyrinomonadaceae bacterium]|nr:hypothetical protein [Pyrinomonadaceae bacterium]
MYLALVNKAARLLLAVSVSVWMAGGCLFGCSNGEVMAAEVLPEGNESSAVVSGDSCDRTRQHDCCTRPNVQKPKARKQVARQTEAKQAARQRTTTGLTASPSALAISPSAVTGLPHGMKDCPLMTNATAVMAKSNGNLPDPGPSSIAVLPAVKNTSEQIEFTPIRSYVPNRGPTHLRCCVFLI